MPYNKSIESAGLWKYNNKWTYCFRRKDQEVQQFSKTDKTQISIIVPTLNEEENIDALIGWLTEVFHLTSYAVEIIIADGGSTDATQSKVEAWASLAPVRFVYANTARGLAGDVLVAAREACGDVIVVMDADLSHSPDMAPVLAIYGGALHYISIGLPGVPYPKNTVSPVAWKEMGDKVEDIENVVEKETGEKPLIVGMDKYFIASEMAFYRNFSEEEANEGSKDTCSINLFEQEGLMYEWWFPWKSQMDKIFIIVSIKPDKLLDGQLTGYFDSLDPIKEVSVTKNNVPAGRFFYRIAKRYNRKS